MRPDTNGGPRPARERWTYRPQAPPAVAAEARRRTAGRAVLELRRCGEWDPTEEYWGEPDGDPAPRELLRIIAAGRRRAFEMEQVIPGALVEDCDDDIIRSADLMQVGLHREARRLLQRMLRQDYRCIDAHAHLGNVAFDSSAARALRHYEMGVAIGEMALDAGFDGVLPWDGIDNRPFLRALHGLGLAHWRLGRFDRAEAVFDSLLWLNPPDNQGALPNLRAVRERSRWRDGSKHLLLGLSMRPPGVLAEAPMAAEEVRASAAGAPAVVALRAFVGYVGGGRRLTQKGNLSLADARALVDIASTGDQMEVGYGDAVFATRSSADLGGLCQLFAWARKAGLVRVSHGRVLATRRGQQLVDAADAAPFFDWVVDALMELGPLASQSRAGLGWWGQVTAMIDALAPHLLLICEAGVAMPVGAITERAAGALVSRIRVSGIGREQLVEHIEDAVIDTVETLVLAGLARWESDRTRPDGEWRWRRPVADRLLVTPAGHAWLQRRFA